MSSIVNEPLATVEAPINGFKIQVSASVSAGDNLDPVVGSFGYSRKLLLISQLPNGFCLP